MIEGLCWVIAGLIILLIYATITAQHYKGIVTKAMQEEREKELRKEWRYIDIETGLGCSVPMEIHTEKGAPLRIDNKVYWLYWDKETDIYTLKEN